MLYIATVQSQYTPMCTGCHLDLRVADLEQVTSIIVINRSMRKNCTAISITIGLYGIYLSV